jgi:hypothetical protein
MTIYIWNFLIERSGKLNHSFRGLYFLISKLVKEYDRVILDNLNDYEKFDENEKKKFDEIKDDSDFWKKYLIYFAPIDSKAINNLSLKCFFKNPKGIQCDDKL